MPVGSTSPKAFAKSANRARRGRWRFGSIGQNDELSAGPDVPPDLGADAGAPGAADRFPGGGVQRAVSARGTGTPPPRALRVGLAAVPSPALRSATRNARGDLAAQAPRDPAGWHLERASHRPGDAAARSRLGSARWCRRPVGRLRMAVDPAARNRSDV